MSRVLLVAGRTREDRRRLAAQLEGLDAFSRPTFLYLTASQLKADSLRRAWWDQPGKPPTWLPTVMTKGAWLEDLAARFGEGRSLLGGVARTQLAGGLWRRLRPNLRAWSRLPDTPSTRSALADFAEAWGHSWPGDRRPRLPAQPEALRFPAENPAALDPHLTLEQRHDAWELVQAWHEALDRSDGWTDRSEALRAVLRSLRSPAPPVVRHLRRHRALIVDDLLGLLPLEQAVLDAWVDAFASAVPDGRVLLCTEVGALPEQLADFFAGAAEQDPSLRAARSLRRAWSARLDHHDTEALVADADVDGRDLADHLAADAVVDAEEANATGLRVRRYSSDADEVRALARSLRAELLAGRDPEDCFVAFPSLDRYLPLVRDAFSAWDIPWVVERGEELATSPPVAAARRVLLAATRGVDRDGLRALLASGWVRLRCTPTDEQVQGLADEAFSPGPDRDRLLSTMAPRIGKPRWATLARLHPAAVEAGADGPRPRSWIPALAAVARAGLRGDGTPAQWARLAELVLDSWALNEVAEIIAAVAEPETVRGVFDALRSALEQLGVRETARLSPQQDPALSAALLANAAALSRFDEVAEGLVASLEAVASTLDRLPRVPGEQDLVAPAPALLREALDETLRDASFRAGERPVGVRLVGFRDLHGLDVPWLWVGGLVEADFPRAAPPSFLLPAGSSLLIELDRAEEDRAIFGSLLRNAGHGERRADAFVCLSVPATIGGADSLPSAPLQDLLDLRLLDPADATLADAFAARQREEEDSLPPISSLDELLSSPALAAAARDLLPEPVTDRMALHRELHDARTQASFGAFDGVLAAGRPWRRGVLNWLAEALRIEHGDLRLPTTALEGWAACPQRYLFQKVLQVAEPRVWQADLHPGEQGDLIHEALRRFFQQRRDAGHASLEGSTPTELAAARDLLARCVEEALEARLAHRDGPSLRRYAADLLAGLRPDDPNDRGWVGRLARFVDHEAVALWDLEPTAMEWSFEDFDPAAAAHLLDAAGPVGAGDVRVLLRGQVDRVDTGHGRLAVWDYKTGDAPTLSKVDRGLALQPPVYLAAARLHLQDAVELDPAESLVGYRELPALARAFPRRRTLASPAVLHELRDRGVVAHSVFSRKGTGTSAPLEAPRWAAWLRRVDWYGQLVAAGVFPTTLAGRKEAHCGRCAYRHTCRLDEVRNATADRAGGPLPAPHPVAEHLEEPS